MACNVIFIILYLFRQDLIDARNSAKDEQNVMMKQTLKSNALFMNGERGSTATQHAREKELLKQVQYYIPPLYFASIFLLNSVHGFRYICN